MAQVLERWWFAVESAAARTCREAGARVTTNFVVLDLVTAICDARDTRRLEVVAAGWPLLSGGSRLLIGISVA